MAFDWNAYEVVPSGGERYTAPPNRPGQLPPIVVTQPKAPPTTTPGTTPPPATTPPVFTPDPNFTPPSGTTPYTPPNPTLEFTDASGGKWTRANATAPWVGPNGQTLRVGTNPPGYGGVKPPPATPPAAGGGANVPIPQFTAGMTPDQVRKAITDYYAARGVTPNPTSVDYWVSKWSEFGQKDPAYFGQRLSTADEFTGGGGYAAPGFGDLTKMDTAQFGGINATIRGISSG
jgi:hypothetical protein